MSDDDERDEEKNYDRNDEKIRQEASGTGNAQAAGYKPTATVNNLLSYPIEKIVFAELIAAIAIQSFICLIGTGAPFSVGLLFLYAPLCICSPFLFGGNAVYGFIIGTTKKDNRIVVLSVVSFLLAIIPACLYFIYRFILNPG